MGYKEFRDKLERFMDGKQIAAMQETAFEYYEDAHGYRPKRKNQKQFAYQFVWEQLQSMSINECIEYMGKFGVGEETAAEFCKSMDM
jgi:hypothetical protein